MPLQIFHIPTVCINSHKKKMKPFFTNKGSKLHPALCLGRRGSLGKAWVGYEGFSVTPCQLPHPNSSLDLPVPISATVVFCSLSTVPRNPYLKISTSYTPQPHPPKLKILLCRLLEIISCQHFSVQNIHAWLWKCSHFGLASPSACVLDKEGVSFSSLNSSSPHWWCSAIHAPGPWALSSDGQYKVPACVNRGLQCNRRDWS